MQQGSVWYFVTFRLEDSLPKELIEQLEKEREQWLKDHKKDNDELTEEEKKEYYRLFSARIEEWLNNGYGKCILKDESVAKIVADTLLHFNGEKYDLDDWVIMPNHVHVLIKPKINFTLSDVMHSIKSYSAHKINELMGTKGSVWMHESYDHIVRNERAFEAIKRYIRENPEKANLSLPDVCCAWRYRSQEASVTLSQEVSVTLLRKLFDYSSDENPFDEETTIKIIDAIENIKIIDPACGSGAFPMGMLHKLELALHKLDPDNKIWKSRLLSKIPPEIREETAKSLENKSINYIRKLGLIEHCIYGVDIQEIAIQISKLRFFISLLVEQEIDDSKYNRDIRPLPNLETKFVAANTLIGLDKSDPMILKSPEVERLEKELFKLREEIFYTNSRKEKIELQKKEERLRDQLKQALSKYGFPNKIAEKITAWDPFDQNTHADWFDPEWMFGVKDGFDIVIGNPPYIKEYTNISAFDGLRDSPYYQGKMDIWYMFACKGLDLLKDNGILTFIAQNNWVTNYGASKLRNKVITETRILQLIDFGNYKIFENAGIQTMIMIFKKDRKTNNYQLDFRRIINDDVNFKDVLDILSKNENKKIEYLNPIINRKEFENKSLTFSQSKIESLLEKICNQGVIRLKGTEIAQGIVCPQDKVIRNTKKYLGDTFKIGDGIFVISDEEKNRIPFTKEELDLIKPYFTSKELGRFYGDSKNTEWIIYTDSSFRNEKRIKKYPNIKRHLDKFKSVITSDNKPYGLHRAREERFFKGEKIVALRKCLKPTFTFTDFDCYVSAAFYVIKTNRINLKYLTGLLNSSVIEFWLKHKGKMQGSNYQIDKEPLLEIPIPQVTETNHHIIQQIISLVDKIIELKKINKNSEISDLEKEINILVYELYGLNEEEIKIVENI